MEAADGVRTPVQLRIEMYSELTLRCTRLRRHGNNPGTQAAFLFLFGNRLMRNSVSPATIRPANGEKDLYPEAGSSIWLGQASHRW